MGPWCWCRWLEIRYISRPQKSELTDMIPSTEYWLKNPQPDARCPQRDCREYCSVGHIWWDTQSSCQNLHPMSVNRGLGLRQNNQNHIQRNPQQECLLVDWYLELEGLKKASYANIRIERVKTHLVVARAIWIMTTGSENRHLHRKRNRPTPWAIWREDFSASCLYVSLPVYFDRTAHSKVS